MFPLTAAIVVIWQVFVPVALVVWVLLKRCRSTFEALLTLAVAWTWFLYIFYVGRWDFTSHYLRYALLIALAAASFACLYKAYKTPFYVPLPKATLFSQLLMLAVFAWLTERAIAGFAPDSEPIALDFPLREGFVSHGGASTVINYHYSDKGAQKYAVDIVRLNRAGMRARGLFPEKLEDYAVFGDTIFCPCDGVVAKMQDGLPNQAIGKSDAENPAGNHIAIACDGVLVMMAHFMPGSLMVQLSDTVRRGQPIARVGNSGNTSNPHLHIHAVQGSDTSRLLSGKSVPMLFNGRFPVRNEQFQRSE
ncbi:MAG: M23 family metallopeptidase [Cytophagales bacterium]|nr:M23 family metallopeptidase [Bernardetiaceae bacterium]MDW8204307.1 M23 family metallopeptidase [Cytophagales bacterium]